MHLPLRVKTGYSLDKQIQDLGAQPKIGHSERSFAFRFNVSVVFLGFLGQFVVSEEIDEEHGEAIRFPRGLEVWLFWTLLRLRELSEPGTQHSDENRRPYLILCQARICGPRPMVLFWGR